MRRVKGRDFLKYGGETGFGLFGDQFKCFEEYGEPELSDVHLSLGNVSERFGGSTLISFSHFFALLRAGRLRSSWRETFESGVFIVLVGGQRSKDHFDVMA